MSLRMFRAGTGGWFFSLNGLASIEEGPRRIGHCVYCAGPCQGLTTDCSSRVWTDSCFAQMGLSREADDDE